MLKSQNFLYIVNKPVNKGWIYKKKKIINKKNIKNVLMRREMGCFTQAHDRCNKEIYFMS